MMRGLGMKILILLIFQLAKHDISASKTKTKKPPPNVIVIVVDDLGWDDVSFHGNPHIATPNIDALAYDGVILDNFYVQPTSTASRAALLTGLYPIHLGLQRGNIEGSQPYGLPLNVTVLPQYLKSLGYATHIVGKWHLGFYAKEFIPTERGFDTHYGSYQDWLDPWQHTYQSDPNDNKTRGKDLHMNGRPLEDSEGTHVLELLTRRAEALINTQDRQQPLFLYVGLSMPKHFVSKPFAPPRYKEPFNEIDDPDLKEFAGLMSMLDDAIANITKSLATNRLIKNSIIFFTTDTGAPPSGGHSNWPLRGVEDDIWEGGIRGAAFVWSPLLAKGGKISRELMHITDICPTILRAAGYNLHEVSDNLDGINMWEVLNFTFPSQRVEILHNIDPVTNTAAIRSHGMKLVTGSNGTHGDRRFLPPIDPSTVIDMLGQFNDSSLAPAIKVIVDGLNGRFDINKSNILNESGFRCEVLDKILKTLHKRALSRAKLMQNKVASVLKSLQRHQSANFPLILACAERGRKVMPCHPGHGPCLFDINNDPCETSNTADSRSGLTKHLIERINFFNSSSRPLIKKAPDTKGYPFHNGGVWKPWLELPPTDGPEYVVGSMMPQTNSVSISWKPVPLFVLPVCVVCLVNYFYR